MNKIEVLPYSHQRIKEIIKEHNAILIPINDGYKANRRKGYVRHYVLVDTLTNEVLLEKVSLQSFRMLFTKEGYPLKREESK